MWIAGTVVAAVALAALAAWLWWRRSAGRPPPELSEHDEGPPPDRDATWDPRERYDDPPH